MKIIEPKFEILNLNPYEGLYSVYEMIKTAGRTCYDSESKKTPFDFVQMLIKSGHGAMLEHGTVYLTLKITPKNGTSSYLYPSAGFVAHYNWSDVVGYITAKYSKNHFSKVVYRLEGTKNAPVFSYYITTNYRVIIENGWEDDLKFITPPTEYHELRVSVRFTTQIAITREYNRHRVNSIAEQSTRYCNYSKDKYNGQITVVKPVWVKNSKEHKFPNLEVLNFMNMCHDVYLDEAEDEWSDIMYWLFANLAAEYAYLNLLRLGRTPQEARTVLSLDTRSELVHTAFVSDWKHFFELRAIGTTGKPHPDAKVLAEPLMEEFKRLKLL